MNRLTYIAILSLSISFVFSDYTGVSGNKDKGGSFSFFYRPGSEGNNNLVIEYEGGGACWDDFSCSIGY